MEDKLGDVKGWHEYIEISGDSCIYHGYNDLVEAGFYESFTGKRERAWQGTDQGMGQAVWPWICILR